MDVAHRGGGSKIAGHVKVKVNTARCAGQHEQSPENKRKNAFHEAFSQWMIIL